jgi:hypothetical protein
MGTLRIGASGRQKPSAQDDFFAMLGDVSRDIARVDHQARVPDDGSEIIS